MKLRFLRTSGFSIRSTADIRRAAWRVLYHWKLPRIEISLDNLPLLEAQRSQLRLRHLHEIMERRTGALLAIAVLIIGLADMVRTWNRSLDHMALVLGAAIAAGLAGRILGRTWVRIRVLVELARLRWKVRRRAVARFAAETQAIAPAPPPALPAAAAASLSASPLQPRRGLLRASCCCGAVAFSVASPPSIMGTCHCTHCRKAGAGTFVQVKRSAFTLESGADAVVTHKSASPHECERSFCSRCGTALGEITSGSATFRVAAACFDDELDIRNGFHEFVAEKPAWHAICDEARQFATQPRA